MIKPAPKLTLSETVLFRVPQFSCDAKLSDCWDELKLSIRDSSEAFYNEIATCTPGGLPNLSARHRHTIWKYFNRACYRATPYGTFAGIGTIQLDKHNVVQAVIQRDQQLWRFIDWTCVDQLTVKFDDLVTTDARLFANSTYYFTESDIRYIGRFDEGYELSDLPKDDLKIRILEACVRPLPISSLFALFPESADRPMFLHILGAMLADQLLISQMQPNIIGQDYFQRIGQPLSKQVPEYIIAERPLLQGGLDQHEFKHLPGLIERLHQIQPSYKSPDLEQFILRVAKKFGSQEVPVMVALDPELGVGYGDMDQPPLNSELINQISKQEDNGTGDINSSLLRLLLPKLISDKPCVIDLENLETNASLRNEPLPNSLPVLCTLADGMIQLEYLGGCTATSLLGRFTLASDAILAQCRKIAGMEQQANPGVLFFDVAYTVAGVVDNVNRRRTIYDYQLSILNYDTSADPLALNDLVLSVQGNELVIRSVSHNKRVVPRLASAYNYLLSDLPVFRLFCDLQHQGIHKNLSLRLRDQIANLDYYPRLQYKNIIVSPATWLIRLEDIKPTANTSAAESLSVYLKEKGVSEFVKLGQTDQTLCINTRKDTELEALLQLLRKQKTLYIEETIIPQKAIIEDADGKPYISQLLLTLHHGQTIYRPAPANTLQQQEGIVEKIIAPGDEWLYFEIFCHPVRADELLTESILHFLEARQEQIMRWFFVRYAERGNHIRIRFRLRQTSAAQEIMAAFGNLMKGKVQTGLVSDLALRLYRRETERYGVANIFFVEVHFHLDSRYVLSILRHGFNDDEKYRLCMNLARHVLETGIFTETEFSKLVQATSQAFNVEHDLDPGRFKLLNAAWLKFGNIKAPELDGETLQHFAAFKSSFVDTLYQYQVSERADIFNSLFHMHVNRMFPISQRTHETVIYYFLEKEFKRMARTSIIPTVSLT